MKLAAVGDDDGWYVVGKQKRSKRRAAASYGHNHSASRRTVVVNASGKIDADLDRLHEILTIAQKNQLCEHLKAIHGDTAINPFPNFHPRQAYYNLSELQNQFERAKQDWASDSAKDALLSATTAAAHTHAFSSVDQAVCLGLGSLSDEGSLFRKDSIRQLVVFMDIVQTLCFVNNDTKICLLAQDPAFNDVDKKFLSSLDIQVLESPTAFTEINEQSFVFAPHYPVCWWTGSMRSGSIPLTVGNDVRKAVDRIPSRSEVQEIFSQALGFKFDSEIVDNNAKEELERFIEIQDSIDFPKSNLHEQAFVDVRIYSCPSSEGRVADSDSQELTKFVNLSWS